MAVILLGIFPAGSAAVDPAVPPVRVALMDLSTDDNSWPSAQAATQFTSLLQIQLADEPGVEWVERAQLDLARQELRLSEMELLSGASPIRRGKWAKADWLVTGQFSLDDKNQRTLSLEITDLQHADVLASKTITLPGTAAAAIQPVQDQVKLVGDALRQLLAEARRRQQEVQGQVLVAPLFVVDLSPFGFDRGAEALERGFYEALDRAAATNRQLRFIRFPKAYRAMDESEMVLDGLVEADPQAWQRTADLYVWATYAVTNSRSGRTSQSRMEFTLQMWDGTSPAHTFREKWPIKSFDGLPPEVAAAMLDRMANRVVAQARRQTPAAVPLSLRREVAESIAQTYRQLAGATHSSLGLHDEAKFVQAVHMLETACFFDPDNADLQVMRISCRWGWWMDFGFKVKNPFWSYWRRSRAWGRYGERFGLGATKTPLPFPYQMQGIPGIYVQSLEEVLRKFPQRYDEDEERQQQRGVHTALVEAQRHGFPTGMPRDLVLKWKAEVEAELADRKKRVSQSAQATAPATNSLPKLSANHVAQPAPPPQSPGSLAKPSAFSAPARASAGALGGGQRRSAPGWYKDLNPNFSMFKLVPPPVLPAALKADRRTVQFPAQFEVQAVLQMALCSGKLLILAMDERSASSTDATPDLEAELLTKRGRLWSLDLTAQSPVLFEPTLLPANIHSFLLENDRLWLAGNFLSCLDLKTRSFRRFGVREGFASASVQSLTSAGGRLFATGDAFQLYQLERGKSEWQKLKLPPARLSTGTGNPCLVTGNSRWLGYVAGSTLLYDCSLAIWTNLLELKSARCLTADEDSFWFGGYEGLGWYALERRAFTASHSPAVLQGLTFSALQLDQPWGQPTVPAEAVNRTAASIERFFKKLKKERAQIHDEKTRLKSRSDPLHLDWRMPGDVTALAHDGDFLWVGTGLYSGGRVLLIHKPTVSLVGSWQVEGHVRSLAVSPKQLWVGSGYGKQLLTCIEKEPMLSVPRSHWLNLSIPADERERLIRGLSARDQAMYAFYAGEDARVLEVLGNLDPAKATLEEMFLLGYACDATGADKPDQAREWFERIAARFPDSPWAAAAQESLAANNQAHKSSERGASLLARYDRDHNGVLDPAERRTMEKDPGYQREEAIVRDEQLTFQLQAIFKRYDRNGDGRLDRTELEALRNSIRIFSSATPEMLAGRPIPLDPLLTRHFPLVEDILKLYGAGPEGTLDAAGLKALAAAIQKNR